MRRITALLVAVLLVSGCAKRAPVASEAGEQTLGQEIRPVVQLTDNITRTSRGFELDGGEGPQAPWSEGFSRAGLVQFQPVKLEKPVEHLGIHLSVDRPEGTLAVLQVRGSQDGDTWTDWFDMHDSGYVRLPARSQYIALQLLMAGNAEAPWVRDLAFTALPSAVTVTIQVQRLPETGPIDIAKPLPPIPGAVVEVVELGLKATADQTGKVEFTLPLGENPPGEAVYTFEAASEDWPYRTAVRERITVYRAELDLLYSTREHRYTDHAFSPRGSVVGILQQKLQFLAPAEALAVRDRWDVPGNAVVCEGAPARQAGEVAVLACQWGSGYNAMFDGRYLFWRQENGSWNAQPYSEQAVRGAGYFLQLRQEGEYLAVVMHVARGMTRFSEEVQLLKRTAGWRPIWLPEERGEDDGYTDIYWEGEGIDRFTAIRWHRDWHGPAFHERWQREGDRYVLLSSVGLTPEEQVVIRFVGDLIRGNEQGAAYTASESLVGQAKRLGLAQAVTSGFATSRIGVDPVVEVTAAGLAWRLTLEQQGTDWRVTAIK